MDSTTTPSPIASTCWNVGVWTRPSSRQLGKPRMGTFSSSITMTRRVYRFFLNTRRRLVGQGRLMADHYTYVLVTWLQLWLWAIHFFKPTARQHITRSTRVHFESDWTIIDHEFNIPLRVLAISQRVNYELLQTSNIFSVAANFLKMVGLATFCALFPVSRTTTLSMTVTAPFTICDLSDTLAMFRLVCWATSIRLAIP